MPNTPCITLRLPTPIQKAIRQLTSTNRSDYIRQSILERIKEQDPALYAQLMEEAKPSTLAHISLVGEEAT